MRPFPIPIAMRTSIGVILIVVAVGLVLCGVGRVLTDAVAWYKEEMMDPYRELRKKARATAKVRRTLEDIGDNNEARPDDNGTGANKTPPNLV